MGLLLLLCSFLPAQITFERWYGGNDDDYGNSVAQTLDGGYIVAGSMQYLSSGDWDVYLIKTDSLGNVSWMRNYGSYDWDYGHSVAQTTDSGYVIAGYTLSYGIGEKAYLIKTNASGDTSWTRIYGNTYNDWGNSVAQTADGGYVIAGWTFVYSTYGDVYLVKTDSAGDTLWTRRYGGDDIDWGNSVAQTADGGYVIAGYTYSYGGEPDVYLVKTDASGDTIWTRSYGGGDDEQGNSVAQTSDGGYIIAGWTSSFGAGSRDVYLIKTDASGDTSWTRTYGSALDDEGKSVVQTTDGGYIVAGNTWFNGPGANDVYLIKTDALGDSLWTKAMGGTEIDGANSVAQTTDRGYIIAGYTESFGAGSSDVYLIKTDSLGNVGITEQPERVIPPGAITLTASPNPFSFSTTLHLSGIGHGAEGMALEVYDVSGRKVRSLKYPMRHAPCAMQVIWDGRDEQGREVQQGVYFLKMGGTPVGKVVKVK